MDTYIHLHTFFNQNAVWKPVSSSFKNAVTKTIPVHYGPSTNWMTQGQNPRGHHSRDWVAISLEEERRFSSSPSSSSPSSSSPSSSSTLRGNEHLLDITELQFRGTENSGRHWDCAPITGWRPWAFMRKGREMITWIEERNFYWCWQVCYSSACFCLHKECP